MAGKKVGWKHLTGQCNLRKSAGLSERFPRIASYVCSVRAHPPPPLCSASAWDQPAGNNVGVDVRRLHLGPLVDNTLYSWRSKRHILMTRQKLQNTQGK